MQISSAIVRATFCAVLLAPLIGRAAAPNDAAENVQAIWKPVEIRYSYTGFTTAYNCDAFETKMKRILIRLGSPPHTKVAARGCTGLNRPSRNFFVDITTATPVPPQEGAPRADTAQDELLKRVGGTKPLPTDPFRATWKTLDLARDPGLDLEPGDCELMQALRDEVLPKLSVKILSDRVSCMPRQLPIQTPELKVAALVPLASPDQPAAIK